MENNKTGQAAGSKTDTLWNDVLDMRETFEALELAAKTEQRKMYGDDSMKANRQYLSGELEAYGKVLSLFSVAIGRQCGRYADAIRKSNANHEAWEARNGRVA